MKKLLTILLIFTLCLPNALAQDDDEIRTHIEAGIKLHDNGEYEEAIEEYKKALKIDKTSSAANYEIASSYFAMKKYEKAISYADKVIDKGAENVDQAYILKGSALDMLGQPDDAIKIYKSAIKKYPENHLLHYNLALTSYNQGNYKETEKALQSSLKIKPGHASSHMLMGYAMSAKGSRVKACLAYYNFLLLEPKGSRAENALEALDKELKKGVKKTGDQTTTITIGSPDKSDEFSSAELMLSMLEATNNILDTLKRTDEQKFADRTKSFFAILGELKDKNKGFWWDYYVDFFYAMKNAEHTEAFSYYITQSRDKEEITNWLKENKA